MELYFAYKEVDLQPTASSGVQEILRKTIVLIGKRYHAETIWAEDNIELANKYFSALDKLKSFVLLNLQN